MKVAAFSSYIENRELGKSLSQIDPKYAFKNAKVTIYRGVTSDIKTLRPKIMLL